MNMYIDFVVPWVDGNDPDWIKEFNKYCPEDKKRNDSRESRYRDDGLLKYWFRAIEKFAPWVNNVYFITCGQKPDWLNIDNPKLKWIKHSDYIPNDCLPLFSSHPIEMFMNHLPGLSEKFVYFNDDFYLSAPITEDFFFHNGLPRDAAIMNPIVNPTISNIVCNNVSEIRRNFSRNSVFKNNITKWFNIKYGKDLIRTFCMLPWNTITGFKMNHFPQPYFKSVLDEVWEKCHDSLNYTMHSKFRNIGDVNQWLFRYWQLCEGKFYPTNPVKGKQFIDFSKNISEFDKFTKNVLKGKYKTICINDEPCEDYDNKLKLITEMFERLLPEKSSFEL